MYDGPMDKNSGIGGLNMGGMGLVGQRRIMGEK